MEMRVLTAETSSLSPAPGAFPDGASGKESVCQCRRHGFDPWVENIPQRSKWQPTPVFLPEKSHGQRSLVGYGPWCCRESDTTDTDEQMAGALRSLSVKFPFREEPVGRCFTLDILHLFSFLRRVSAFLGLAHVNTEKRVREKQLEVKIIYFNHVNGSSVKLWYSVAFNQINLNFLATSLLI